MPASISGHSNHDRRHSLNPINLWRCACDVIGTLFLGFSALLVLSAAPPKGQSLQPGYEKFRANTQLAALLGISQWFHGGAQLGNNQRRQLGS